MLRKDSTGSVFVASWLSLAIGTWEVCPRERIRPCFGVSSAIELPLRSTAAGGGWGFGNGFFLGLACRAEPQAAPFQSSANFDLLFCWRVEEEEWRERSTVSLRATPLWQSSATTC